MKSKTLSLSIIFSALIFQSCKDDNILFQKLSSSETGIDFANTITESDSLNVFNFEYIYNGGGLGIGDFNGDGFQDVYFAGNQVSSKLYINKGTSLQFEDVTQQSKTNTQTWCTGVSVIDINQDGKLDVYLSTIHPKKDKKVPNLLFINQGNNKNGVPIFVESAQKVGLADSSYATQMAFLDYDLDGDLDAYLLTNALESFSRNNVRPKEHNTSSKSIDKFFRNDGNGADGLPIFKNVSKEVGITEEGWGLGICVKDINRDGYPDVYVANDFLSNDLLYINNRNGTFTNKISEYLRHQSHNSMGIDIADFNNDGFEDISVMDMMPDDNLRQKNMFGSVSYDAYDRAITMGYEPQFVRNMLQLNNGNGSFSDIGYLAGTNATDWSWSTLFADFDNDGWRDLLITNGYRKDVTDLDFITYQSELKMFGSDTEKLKKLRDEAEKMAEVKKSNFLFHNNKDLTFTDKAKDWGLSEPSFSNGAAYADFDNDGDLDLVMNNINDKAFVYKNTLNDTKESKKNDYLRIKFEGNEGNRDGLGAKVEVFYEGKKQFAEHTNQRGYVSSVEPIMHIGLGENTVIDSLKISWQSGKSQILTNIKTNQILVIQEKNALLNQENIPLNTTIFEEVSAQHNINIRHEENLFVDFKNQPCLPHKHSQAGPGLAVGDVNGDGLDDFYMGTSYRNNGKIYLQTPDGKFKPSEIYHDKEPKIQEDLGVLFFDADGDKDLDFYAVSGGTEFGIGSQSYQDRLYKNDGKGHFQHDLNALPSTVASGGVVTAADFDKDGDLDLFVGGRIVAGRYPEIPESYLLQNDGKGNFKNITPDALKKVGLITAALWTDYDNDNDPDLILTGEWMPILIFDNKNGQLSENINSNLKSKIGWWNSLTGADFDNDGDIDYVAGNLGLNSKYKATDAQPVTIYAKDYDQNGMLDPLMSHYIQGKEFLTHPRMTLVDQLVAMRRLLPTFKDYGKMGVEDILKEGDLKGANIIKANYFQSAYIENKGKGNFEIKPLPMEAQFAPTFGLCAKDVDQDGNLDLMTVGNSYATEVLTGRYDAGIGNYLKGDGKGNFKNIAINQSGFFVNGDAKAMAEIRLKNGENLVLVTRNNDMMLAFRQKSSVKTHTKNPKRKEETYYGSGYLSQSSVRKN